MSKVSLVEEPTLKFAVELSIDEARVLFRFTGDTSIDDSRHYLAQAHGVDPETVDSVNTGILANFLGQFYEALYTHFKEEVE